jgi:hypothetical protein
MGSTRVYIAPYDESGVLKAYEDVTKYVQKIGRPKKDADSLDFQLGVYRNSNVSIALNNRDGKFSDVDQLESMFRYTRADSKVKITWMLNEEPPVAGFVYPEEFYPHFEATIFEGLLNDDGFKEDAQTEVADFKVLGFESLFDRAEVPIADITIGDLTSEIIYTCLNQSPITDFLTIDLANIVPAQDEASDVISWMETKTVQEALDELLKVSNSVLDVIDGVVFVYSRDPAPLVSMDFFGPASQEGIENVVTVNNITNGINRCWNYFFWKDTSLKAKDNPSIAKNLVRKQEIDCEMFTDSAKRGRMLAALLAEFKDPKKEFELVTRLTLDTVDLQLLDKITVDYPTVFVATEGFYLPICGVAILGDGSTGPTGAVLPRGLWSLTLTPDIEWKIIAKEIDLNAETVTIKVRKV